MRYALNATPINGHDTLFGAGHAYQELDGAGSGYLRMHPRGQAAMGLTAHGNGIIAILGRALGELQLTALGLGHLVMHGIGMAVDELRAFGNGVVIPKNRGAARMSMDAIGIGRIAITAAGRAIFYFVAVDRSRNSIASRGAGLAELVLCGMAGIPRPKTTPTTYSPAHPSRLMEVGPDGLVLIPADATRTFTVPNEARTYFVSPERDT